MNVDDLDSPEKPATKKARIEPKATVKTGKASASDSEWEKSDRGGSAKRSSRPSGSESSDSDVSDSAMQIDARKTTGNMSRHPLSTVPALQDDAFPFPELLSGGSSKAIRQPQASVDAPGPSTSQQRLPKRPLDDNVAAFCRLCGKVHKAHACKAKNDRPTLEAAKAMLMASAPTAERVN